MGTAAIIHLYVSNDIGGNDISKIAYTRNLNLHIWPFFWDVMWPRWQSSNQAIDNNQASRVNEQK